MKTFGTFLLVLGAWGCIYALIMAFFSNIKLHNPDNERDIVDSNKAITFCRKLFFVALVIIIIGAILIII